MEMSHLKVNEANDFRRDIPPLGHYRTASQLLLKYERNMSPIKEFPRLFLTKITILINI